MQLLYFITTVTSQVHSARHHQRVGYSALPLPMELCDVILRTNRVRCALNMEILDLLNEESVSGARSSRASL